MTETVFQAFSFDMSAEPKKLIDVEELFNRLNPSALGYLPPPSSATRTSRIWTPKDLEEKISVFLDARCRKLSELEGPYDRLVKGIGDDTSFISFNWDVLLETALRRQKRQYTYLDDNTDEYNWVNRPKTTFPNTTTVLKPHGSVNWVAVLDREGMRVDVGSTSNVYPMVPFGEYRMFHRKNPTGPLNFGDTEEHVVERIGSKPAIVPPGTARRLSPGGRTRDEWVDDGHTAWMKAIWRNIETKLTEAAEIVIIGYSLPGTDLASIEMLRRCLSPRAGVDTKRVRLVDRNAKLVKRYRRILGTEVEYLGDDFAKFDPGQLKTT